MSVNDIEVHGAEVVNANPVWRTHQEGDPAIYFINNERIVGSIEKIYDENGRKQALFKPFNKNKSTGYTVNLEDKDLQSLFHQKKDGSLERLKFSKQEIAKLFYGTKEGEGRNYNRSFNITYEKAKELEIITQLAKGYDTKVIPNLKLQIQDKETNSIKVILIEGTLKAVMSSKYGLQLKADSKIALTPEGTLDLERKIFDYELSAAEKTQLQKAFKEEDITQLDLGLKSVEIPKKDTGEIIQANVYLALDLNLQKVVAVNEKAVNLDYIYKYKPTEAEKKTLQEGKALIIDYPVSEGKTEKRALKVMVTNNYANQGVSFSKPGNKNKIYEKLTTPTTAPEKKKSKGVKM